MYELIYDSDYVCKQITHKPTQPNPNYIFVY